MAAAKTEGAKPAKLLDLDELYGQSCPNCSVGVVLITVYDPDASNEQGENEATVVTPSGGRYEAHCFNCTWHGSFPASKLIEEVDA